MQTNGRWSQPDGRALGQAEGHGIFATPGTGLGNFEKTAGSCPGMMNPGRVAICFMRSCARRFDAASTVVAIGACRSRFSYRYILSLASTMVPIAVCTPTYCDCQVCLPPV